MRIGFDVDGVLAYFTKGYQELMIEKSGRDLFNGPVYENPPCWNWDLEMGYTKEEEAACWAYIINNPMFWGDLEALKPAIDLVADLNYVSNDIYFITDRPGQGAQAVTANWLAGELGWIPSTIISRKGKGIIAERLGLDVYLDDKVENIIDVQAKSPSTRAYLVPPKGYNTNHPLRGEVKLSADSVKEVLIVEELL